MSEETITLKWMLYKNKKVVTLQTSYTGLRYWGILDFYKNDTAIFPGFSPKKEITKEQLSLKTHLLNVSGVYMVTFTPLGVDILFNKEITTSFYKIEPWVNNMVKISLHGHHVIIKSPALR